MRRLLVLSTFLLLMPATGFAQQSFNFYVGGFAPKGVDSRSPDDVLVNNLDFLAFRMEDFASGAFGAEWEFPLNDYFHGSLGFGMTSKSVPSVYNDFIEDDLSEIEQDLKLRIAPLTATVRFLPMGSNAAVVPYIGAGIGIFSWRYSESGEFIDFGAGGEIFRDTFRDSGATAGPVILGGLSFPAGNWLIGGEVRYQSAQGELDLDQSFAGSKIDLGGFTYSAMFKVRF